MVHVLNIFFHVAIVQFLERRMAKMNFFFLVGLVVAVLSCTSVSAFSLRSLVGEAGSFLEVSAEPRRNEILKGGRSLDPQELEREKTIENCVESAKNVAEKKADEEQKKTAVAIAKCQSENQNDATKGNGCIIKLQGEAAAKKVQADLDLKSKKEACTAANPKRCPPSPKCCLLISFGKSCPCEVKEKGKVCKNSHKVRVVITDEVAPKKDGSGSGKGKGGGKK